MAREYRIDVVVDAAEAVKGSREFTMALDKMAEKTTSAAKTIDGLITKQTRFAKSMDAAAASVYSYRDILKQLSQSFDSGVTRIDRYTTEVATLAVGFRDAADAARELVREMEGVGKSSLPMADTFSQARVQDDVVQQAKTAVDVEAVVNTVGIKNDIEDSLDDVLEDLPPTQFEMLFDPQTTVEPVDADALLDEVNPFADVEQLDLPLHVTPEAEVESLNPGAILADLQDVDLDTLDVPLDIHPVEQVLDPDVDAVFAVLDSAFDDFPELHVKPDVAVDLPTDLTETVRETVEGLPVVSGEVTSSLTVVSEAVDASPAQRASQEAVEGLPVVEAAVQYELFAEADPVDPSALADATRLTLPPETLTVQYDLLAEADPVDPTAVIEAARVVLPPESLVAQYLIAPDVEPVDDTTIRDAAHVTLLPETVGVQYEILPDVEPVDTSVVEDAAHVDALSELVLAQYRLFPEVEPVDTSVIEDAARVTLPPESVPVQYDLLPQVDPVDASEVQAAASVVLPPETVSVQYDLFASVEPIDPTAIRAAATVELPAESLSVQYELLPEVQPVDTSVLEDAAGVTLPTETVLTPYRIEPDVVPVDTGVIEQAAQVELPTEVVEAQYEILPTITPVDQGEIAEAARVTLPPEAVPVQYELFAEVEPIDAAVVQDAAHVDALAESVVVSYELEPSVLPVDPSAVEEAAQIQLPLEEVLVEYEFIPDVTPVDPTVLEEAAHVEALSEAVPVQYELLPAVEPVDADILQTAASVSLDTQTVPVEYDIRADATVDTSPVMAAVEQAVTTLPAVESTTMDNQRLVLGELDTAPVEQAVADAVETLPSVESVTKVSLTAQVESLDEQSIIDTVRGVSVPVTDADAVYAMTASALPIDSTPLTEAAQDAVSALPQVVADVAAALSVAADVDTTQAQAEVQAAVFALPSVVGEVAAALSTVTDQVDTTATQSAAQEAVSSLPSVTADVNAAVQVLPEAVDTSPTEAATQDAVQDLPAVTATVPASLSVVAESVDTKAANDEVLDAIFDLPAVVGQVAAALSLVPEAVDPTPATTAAQDAVEGLATTADVTTTLALVPEAVDPSPAQNAADEAVANLPAVASDVAASVTLVPEPVDPQPVIEAAQAVMIPETYADAVYSITPNVNPIELSFIEAPLKDAVASLPVTEGDAPVNLTAVVAPVDPSPVDEAREALARTGVDPVTLDVPVELESTTLETEISEFQARLNQSVLDSVASIKDAGAAQGEWIWDSISTSITGAGSSLDALTQTTEAFGGSLRQVGTIADGVKLTLVDGFNDAEVPFKNLVTYIEQVAKSGGNLIEVLTQDLAKIAGITDRTSQGFIDLRAAVEKSISASITKQLAEFNAELDEMGTKPKMNAKALLEMRDALKDVQAFLDVSGIKGFESAMIGVTGAVETHIKSLGKLGETEEQQTARLREMVRMSQEMDAALYATAEAERSVAGARREAAAAFDRNGIDEGAESYRRQMESLMLLDVAMARAVNSNADLRDAQEQLADAYDDGLIGEKEHKDMLDQLEQAQRTIIKRTEDEANALEALRGKMDPLGTSLRKLVDETEEWIAAMQRGKVLPDEFGRGVASLQGRFTQLQATLNGGGPGGGGGGGGGPFGGANRGFDQLSMAAQSLTRNLLALIGVGGGLSIFRKAVADVSEFEKILVETSNSASLTKDETEALAASVDSMANQFGQSRLDEVAAALEITKKGFRDAGDAMRILAEANELAETGFGDTAAAATSLATAMSAFELDTAQAAEASDVLAVASHGSSEELSAMTQTLARLGTKVAQSGISLKDYATAVSTLRESGMESRKAMAALGALVESVSDISAEAEVRFERAGIAIDSQRIAAEGLAPVLQEIYEKTGGNKAALEQLLGSAEAATAVIAIMKNEGENYARAAEHMTNASAEAAEMAAKVDDTFKKQGDNLKARLQTRLDRLVESLQSEVVPALKFLNENVDAVFGTLTALATVLGGLAALRLLKTGFTFLTTSITGMGTAAKVASAEITQAAAVMSRAQRMANTAAGSTGVLSKAMTVGAGAAAGLGRAAGLAFGAIGGWATVLLTAAGRLAQLKVQAELAEQAMIDLKTATQNFIDSLEGMSRLDLITKKAEAYGDLITKSQELEAAQTKLASTMETAESVKGRGRMGFAQQIIKETAEVNRLKDERAEYAKRVIATNQEMVVSHQDTGRAATDAAADAATAMVELGSAVRDELDAIRKQDPTQGLQDEVARLELLKAKVMDVHTILSAEERSTYLTAINRQLEEATVKANQLALQNGPLRESYNQLIGSVDSVSASFTAYDEKLRTLDFLMNQHLITQETYTEQQKLAAIATIEAASGLDPLVAAATTYAAKLATLEQRVVSGKISQTAYTQEVILAYQAYQQAVTGGDKYTQALNKIKDVIDPATAAQREFNQAMRDAALFEGRGLSTEELELYRQKLEATKDAAIRLHEVEQNGISELAAKYDPLIANELERTKALIEMQKVIESSGRSQEEQMRLAEEFGRVINQQYDKAARAIKASSGLAHDWQVVWEESIKRIDGMFVDLWKNLGSGTEKFFDDLKDVFKQGLAEIAHAAITRPILFKIKQVVTGEQVPGEVFGQGTTGGLLNTFRNALGLGGGARPGASVTTHSQHVAAIYEGVAKALRENHGEAAMPFVGAIEDFSSTLTNVIMNGDAGLISGMEALEGALSGGFSQLSGGLERTAGMSAAAGQALGIMPGDMPLPGGGGDGGGGDGGAGGGVMGSVKMVFGKFAKSFGAFTTAMQTTMQGFLQGAFYNLEQVGALAQAGGAGAYGALAGQAVAGAGVGLLSGGLTDQLLGQRGKEGTTQILSGLGGVIGSIFGPLGSLAGGAIGSFVSNLIGGGKKIEKFGFELTAIQGELVGETFQKIKEYGSFFSSSTKYKREPWEDEVFKALKTQFDTVADMLRDVAEQMDVSPEAINKFTTGTVQIVTKGKTPEEIQAEIEQALTDLAGRQIDAFLQQTEGVAPLFEKLMNLFRDGSPALKQFAGNISDLGNDWRNVLRHMGHDMQEASHYTKEFIAAFEQVAKLMTAMDLDPIAEARKLIDEQSKTMTERYEDLKDAAREAADEFDGSIESLTKVTDAFVMQRLAAVELAVALEQAAEEISGMFQSTAQSIRESLMTPEELYNYRTAFVEEQAALLRTTTDPEELKLLATSINEVINQLYSGLDEGQKQALAPGFLDFLEDIDKVVQEQIGIGLDDITSGAGDMNAEVTAALLDFADQQAAAAQQAQAAAQLHANAAAQFSGAVGFFSGAVQQMIALMQQQSGGGTGFTAGPAAPAPMVRSTVTSGFGGFSSGREVNG